MPRLTGYSLWVAAVAVCLAGPLNSDDKPAPPKAAPAAVKSHEDPAVALDLLQKAHGKDGGTFVLQEELDPLIDKDGGGACPSAAAIDLLQALRLMAGLDSLANPHKAVLEAFAKNKDLLKGRLSNEQLVNLIKFYQPHLGGTGLDVRFESAPNSGYRGHTKTWAEQDGPDLGLAPRTIKVVSYTVSDAKGTATGRHFVLLKSHAGGRVKVVDPAKPAKDHEYLLEYKAGDRGTKARLFLNNPPEFPRRENLTYEVNTVFAVALQDKGPAPKPAAASAEYVKGRIDQTADELRGTKDFLDPRVWRKKTAAFGLPGLDLPAEYGGSDWPATKMVEVFRRAGYHNLNFRDVVGGAHVRPLLASKNPEVAEVVRQVARGEGYVAIAITEPEAGSDVPSIQSTSRKVKGGYLLTGTKLYNARLEQATHVIIFTQGTTGVPGRLSVFVLPISTPGLKFEKLEAHGLTGNSFGGVSFKDLFVPDSALVGADGDGLRIFRKHFLYWRLMQAAAALGTGESSLDQMAVRIRSREAFGGPIGRFTHLQQPIGQHTTELRMALSFARDAAELIDRDDYDAAEPLINGLKAEGVEIALRATDAAMRAFGGEGYSTRVDLGDRLRDLNGLRIADGTTDVMRMLVVRQTFGDDYWYMAVQPKRETPKPAK
jgi:alkylation response protein AidB-like acyl-CoA dehydrogenase